MRPCKRYLALQREISCAARNIEIIDHPIRRRSLVPAGMLHAQRPEQALGGPLFQALPRRLFEQAKKHVVGRRVVTPDSARCSRQGHRGIVRELICLQPPTRQALRVESAAHGEQMQQRDLRLGSVSPRRQELGDGLIETLELARIQGHSDQDRRHALGRRSNFARHLRPTALSVDLEQDTTVPQDKEAGRVARQRVFRRRIQFLSVHSGLCRGHRLPLVAGPVEFLGSPGLGRNRLGLSRQHGSKGDTKRCSEHARHSSRKARPRTLAAELPDLYLNTPCLLFGSGGED